MKHGEQHQFFAESFRVADKAWASADAKKELGCEAASTGGLRRRSRERRRRVSDVLTAVGLDAGLALARFAHEFSGGQCQRLCIAR
jgi:ABC-type dipeptide/oligopeptide/nickel transport system ATPase subunit